MLNIEIGGKQVEAEVTFLTAQIYEAEFRSDMIQDYFGREKTKIPTDDENVVQEDGDATIVQVDFTQTNWTAAVKVLWAAVKTANPSTPGYAVWARSATGANMWEVADVLTYEIVDCFFRPLAAEAQKES